MKKLILAAALLAALAPPVLAGRYTTHDDLPPEPYLSWAEAVVAETSYLTLNARKLQKACGVQFKVLACHVDMMGLKVIYVWDGLRGNDLRVALLHEVGHELGWSHE